MEPNEEAEYESVDDEEYPTAGSGFFGVDANAISDNQFKKIVYSQQDLLHRSGELNTGVNQTNPSKMQADVIRYTRLALSANQLDELESEGSINRL